MSMRAFVWPKFAAALAGCVVFAAPALSQPAPIVQSAFVLQGAEGVFTVRAVVDGPVCPTIKTERGSVATTPRSFPEPHDAANDPGGASKRVPAGDFPMRICEATLANSTRSATLVGQVLPLPLPVPARIVVIGDTGCRLKGSKTGGAFQDCNSPSAYPFARIARAAALWKPDLVVHVGDYLYRESPCPNDHAGCEGSPWGDNWQGWKADFFDPARPLLAVAPIVAARGNHEICERAGAGYRLLLDTAPLAADTDCTDRDKDGWGDFSPTYAVPLGHETQLVVFDSSRAGNSPVAVGNPDYPAFLEIRSQIEALSRKAKHTILVDHHPILAFAAAKGPSGPILYSGNAALISTFMADGQPLTPKGVDLVLSGHVHVWEALSFSSDHPAQIVAGFSGTDEDTVPLPAAAPSGHPPAPGAVVAAMSSWVDGFGFMTMTRLGAARWKIEVRDVDGKVVNTCALQNRNLSCEIAQPPTPPKP